MKQYFQTSKSQFYVKHSANFKFIYNDLDISVWKHGTIEKFEYYMEIFFKKIGILSYTK